MGVFLAFDKSAYQREYMKRKRESNAGLSNKQESNKAVLLDKSNWPWDEHHIYRKCPHGMRYCLKCGTTVERENPTPEQWTKAYNILLAGIERSKRRNKDGVA